MAKVQFKAEGKQSSSPFSFEMVATVDAGNHNLSMSDHTVRDFCNKIYDLLRDMGHIPTEIKINTIEGENNGQK